MKQKLDGGVAERTGAERRVLAVGKRVRNRWLVEMSLARRTVAPATSEDTEHARAA